jgi:MFS family permease
MLYAADALSVTAGVVVVLAGAVVYTLGELTTGPVVVALSAEAAPAAQRGRYMAATQLAWGTSGAVGPLLYSSLLDRGSLAMWGGTLVLCAVWAGLVLLLSARMPLARERVTNVAEVEVVGDPDLELDSGAEAPSTS